MLGLPDCVFNLTDLSSQPVKLAQVESSWPFKEWGGIKYECLTPAQDHQGVLRGNSDCLSPVLMALGKCHRIYVDRGFPLASSLGKMKILTVAWHTPVTLELAKLR